MIIVGVTTLVSSSLQGLGWYLAACYSTVYTERFVPIMLLKLPIMLWSNAVDSCLMYMLHKFNIFFLLPYLAYRILFFMNIARMPVSSSSKA